MDTKKLDLAAHVEVCERYYLEVHQLHISDEIAAR